MANGIVTVHELADEIGIDHTVLRKYLRKHDVALITVRGKGSQPTHAMTVDEADRVRALRESDGYGESTTPGTRYGWGYFYAIQVVPDLSPNRIKLGYAGDVQIRLANHRTSAPTATLLKSWSCRDRWEFTAIDAITRVGCTLLLNEVFEIDSLEELCERGDAFFSMLPSPDAERPG